MVLVWDPTAGLAMSGSYRSTIRALVPHMRKLAAERGQEPAACWAAASARFKADPGVKRSRLGLPTFLNQLERWLEPDAPPARAVDGPRGDAYRILTPPREETQR